MAVERQPHPQDPGTVGRDMFTPIVGEAVQKLELLVPSFNKDLLEVVADIMGKQSGVRMARIALTHEPIEGGEKQKLEVILSNNSEHGDELEIEVLGDWSIKPDIPRGVPLKANYGGAFFRKRKPDLPEPYAREGVFIGPDDPFGLAMVGKGEANRWPLYLPAREFPEGGIITKFIATDGEEVEAGKTILCYVER